MAKISLGARSVPVFASATFMMKSALRRQAASSNWV
jgi:hypothetical protein